MTKNSNQNEVLTALLDQMIEEKVNAAVPVEVKRQLELRELPPQLLTRPQVCEALSITLPTLHRLMRDGRITYVKVGRKTLFPRESFEASLRDGGLKKYGRA